MKYGLCCLQRDKNAMSKVDEATVKVLELKALRASTVDAEALIQIKLWCKYRQLYAYAMRHFLDMPKEPCKKDLLAKRMISAEKTVLRKFADLANRLRPCLFH